MSRSFDKEMQADVARAIACHAERRYDEAARLFESVRADAPDDADVLRLNGLALVRAGQTSSALPLLQRARQLAPREPLAHLHYGIALHEMGRYERAAALFRRAALLAPADPAPWTNLSAALVALGHAPAARAAARRAIRSAPDLAEAHYALGAAELAADDPQAAQESFLRAIQRRRDMPQAWINLVLILARQGQAGLAQQAIAQGLAACPGNGALRAAQASFALLSGEHDAAIATLRDVLVQDPGCVAARLTLAEAVLLDEGPREALALLDGAAPAGREGAHWRAHRALALLQLNEDAAAQLELGVVAPPYGDAAILISWARCNLALHAGRTDEAAQEAAHMDTLAADEAGMLYRASGDRAL